MAITVETATAGIQVSGPWVKIQTLLQTRLITIAEYEIREFIERSGKLLVSKIKKGMSKRGNFDLPFKGLANPDLAFVSSSKSGRRRTAETPYQDIVLWTLITRRSNKDMNREGSTRKLSSAKPLFDLRELYNAIQFKQVSKYSYGVGVFQNFMRGKPKRRTNLALIHEFGAVTKNPVTGKSQILPPRPFLRPGFQDAEKDIREEAIVAIMNIINKVVVSI